MRIVTGGAGHCGCKPGGCNRAARNFDELKVGWHGGRLPQSIYGPLTLLCVSSANRIALTTKRTLAAL